MFSSFLDGLSPTVPAELSEPARDSPPPGVEQTFETHLQRTRKSTPAATADDRPNADDRAAATTVQSDAKEGDQDELHDARDDEARPVAENGEAEQESRDGESESTGTAETGHVDVPSDAAAPGTFGQVGQVEPAGEAASLEQDATRAGQTDGSEPIKSAGSRQDIAPIASAIAHKPERPEGANPAATENSVEIADSIERSETASNSAGVKAPVPTGSTLVGDAETTAAGEPGTADEPGAADERRTAKGTGTGTTTVKESDRAAGTPGTAIEADAAARQISTGVASIARTVSSESEQKSESPREVDKSPPPSAVADGTSEATATSGPHSRFAQQLVTGGGERGWRTAATGELNQTRFVDRVARAFRATAGQGGTVKLRLHPRELGSLQMELKVQGNALTARLEAETPAARALLVESLPVLRERLAEQGIRIEQFDVDLMQRQPQNLPDGTGERPGDEQNANGSSRADAESGESRSDETRQARVDQNQQLNIIV